MMTVTSLHHRPHSLGYCHGVDWSPHLIKTISRTDIFDRMYNNLLLGQSHSHHNAVLCLAHCHGDPLHGHARVPIIVDVLMRQWRWRIEYILSAPPALDKTHGTCRCEVAVYRLPVMWASVSGSWYITDIPERHASGSMSYRGRKTPKP